LEVTGHFLERNDFRPFPEMSISVVNVFVLQEQIKSSKVAANFPKIISTKIISEFVGNHFLVQLIISELEVNDFSQL